MQERVQQRSLLLWLLKLLITNLKVTMYPGVPLIKVMKGKKPRIAKKIMRLSPQSTAQMPFFASPVVWPVFAAQAQLE